MDNADLPIRCQCGGLRGIARGVTQKTSTRIVCYCSDCQAFARHLGNAERVLDTHGGSEVLLVSPAALSFVSGTDNLACLRLSPNGLLRWHSACCNTAIANTPAESGIPFVSLVRTCLDATSETIDSLAGPVRSRVHGRFARGDRATLDAHDKTPLSLLMRISGRLLRSRLRGEHKKSPFFNAESGLPVIKPYVLGKDERRRAQDSREPS